MSAYTLKAFQVVNGCEILLKVSEGRDWHIRVFCGMIFSLLLQSSVQKDFLNSCSKDTFWRIYKLQRSCVIEFDNAHLQHRGMASHGIVQMYNTMTILISESIKEPSEWMTHELAKESVKKIIKDQGHKVNPGLQNASFEFLFAALSQGQKPVAQILITSGVVPRILRNLRVDSHGDFTDSSQMLLGLLTVLCELSSRVRRQAIVWCHKAPQDELTQIVKMHVLEICQEEADQTVCT